MGLVGLTRTLAAEGRRRRCAVTEEPDPFVVDWAEKATGLVELARDEQRWYEALVPALLRPGDRVAVDVGCGGGGMTLALAAALGAAPADAGTPAAGAPVAGAPVAGAPAAGGAAAGGTQVVAVDGAPEVLEAVRQRLAGSDAAPLARVDLVTADLGSGVEPVQRALRRPADLVWASASVHHVGDQQRAIDALASLLAPGGRLALAEGGLGPYHLPWDLGVGEPGLEQRLYAANDRWFARMRAHLPASVRMPYGWTEALRRAGLTGVTTRSTLQEQPTLPEPARGRIVERFERWVDRLREADLLDAADLATWQRLLDSRDAAWLGHRTDLYVLRARSVHLGTRPHSPSAVAGV
jgi:SAM-dependent methyltransferase